MALSLLAQDILSLLPDDSTLIRDYPTHITAQLSPTALLTHNMLAEIYKLSPKCRCDIEFTSKLVDFYLSDDAGHHIIRECSPRDSSLVAETQGEQQAVDTANALTGFDYDYLVPSFGMHTTGNHTVLSISRLYHVSHDTLAEQVPTTCVRFEYRMEDSSVLLYFAAQKKRKLT